MAASKAKKTPGRTSARATIEDLVRKSGFSYGTVSRAFNNSPHINPRTREKILEAAREIGYQPHAGARLIKSERTRRWGILLPNFDNPYYTRMFEAFEQEARRRDTFLQLGLFYNESRLCDRLVAGWAAGEIDGLIADVAVQSSLISPAPGKTPFPVLFIHSSPTEEYDRLLFDRTVCVEHALRSLRLYRHARVAYVGLAGPNERESRPFLIWREWWERHGEGDPEEYCYFTSNNAEGGIRACEEFRRRGARPTAVAAYNDIIACGIFQFARNQAIRIPDQLSVVGNDDIEEGRRLGLTTCSFDLRYAAELVFTQLEKRRQLPDTPAITLRVEGQFLLRDSVGPVCE